MSGRLLWVCAGGESRSEWRSLETDMRFAILNANRYSFPAKDTGELIEGVSLHVVDLDNPPNGKKDFKGPDVVKLSGADDCFRDLTEVPGIYECSVTMKPGKEKQATLKVVAVKLVQGISLSGTPVSKGA